MKKNEKFPRKKKKKERKHVLWSHHFDSWCFRSRRNASRVQASKTTKTKSYHSIPSPSPSLPSLLWSLAILREEIHEELWHDRIYEKLLRVGLLSNGTSNHLILSILSTAQIVRKSQMPLSPSLRRDQIQNVSKLPFDSIIMIFRQQHGRGGFIYFFEVSGLVWIHVLINYSPFKRLWSIQKHVPQLPPFVRSLSVFEKKWFFHMLPQKSMWFVVRIPSTVQSFETSFATTT